MQYPEGDVPGTPGMNAVNQRFRPPLTPWGQARLEAARPLVGPKAIPGEENAPSLRCDPDGPPKLLNHPNPFEIVQIPGRVFMFFEEQHIWRTIWADGRPLPKDPEPRWLGYSVGRWDGDTFIVESTGYDDRSWLDTQGHQHSEEMKVVETYRRTSYDTLEVTLTINDPKTYTQPWLTKATVKLSAGTEMGEYFCVPSESDEYNQRLIEAARAGKK